MRDSTFFFFALIYFGTLGFLLPSIQAGVGSTVTSHTIRGAISGAGGTLLDANTVISVIFNIITIGFWSYGTIPVVVDVLITLPIQVYFVVILFKWIRGVSS